MPHATRTQPHKRRGSSQVRAGTALSFQQGAISSQLSARPTHDRLRSFRLAPLRLWCAREGLELSMRVRYGVGFSQPLWPRVMRRVPRGTLRSVDRGIVGRALNREIRTLGCRPCQSLGKAIRGVAFWQAAFSTRRGRSTLACEKLQVLDRGGLVIGLACIARSAMGNQR